MSALSSILDPGDIAGVRSSASATKSQEQAAQIAEAEIRRQFDIQQEALAPFRELSLPGLTQASALAGASGVDAQQQAIGSLGLDPGRAFTEQEAQRNILRNASATGGLGGGNVLRDLQAQGVTAGQNQFNDQFNRLSGLAGTAQTTTGQLGQVSQNFASSIGDQFTNQATATASGIQAQQQAKSNFVGTAIGVLGSIISDEDVKHDVSNVTDEELFDKFMSVDIKHWRYNADQGMGDELQLGPMYQDSPDLIKEPGQKALNLHNELWLIAGAMRHMYKVINNG